MKSYLRGRSKDYRNIASSLTRKYLDERIDTDVALKCSIALKKRDFYVRIA